MSGVFVEAQPDFTDFSPALCIKRPQSTESFFSRGKVMSEYTLYMATVLLITVSVFVLNPAQAASHPSDFGEVAGMADKSDDR